MGTVFFVLAAFTTDEYPTMNKSLKIDMTSPWVQRWLITTLQSGMNAKVNNSSGLAIRTGLPRQCQRFPPKYMWVPTQVTLTMDKDKPG